MFKRLFRSSTLESTVSQDNASLEQIVQAMAKGSSLHKARTYLKFYKRTYHVDMKTMRLKYGPSRKWCQRSHIPSINLYEVTDIRSGWHTDTFNDIKSDWKVDITREDLMQRYPFLSEEASFSIVSGHDVLDLIAPSREVRDAWVKGLEHLVQTCKSERRKEQHDRWLKEQFVKADVSKTNSLNFQECLTLLNNLNIHMDKAHVKILFDKANYKHEKHKGVDVLDKEEFVKFYYMLLQRPELEEIFKKFTINNATIMGPEELLKFLINEQKMTDVTIEDCRRFIEQFEPQENQSELGGKMTPQGFSDMLASEALSIFRKEHKQVCQDMDQPLNNYFVASSHNTYLLGGQLVGESSVEGYIRALQQGCRCLELDCWDGLEDEPIIYHGYTLTSQILFVDVLNAIKDYAFKVSPYPVVLSIENHCTPDFQRKMASHFIEVFGDMLCKNFLESYDNRLPPLSMLKKKILVKVVRGKSLGRALKKEKVGRMLLQCLQPVREDGDDEAQPSCQGKRQPPSPTANGNLASAPQEEEEEEEAEIPGYDIKEDEGDVKPPPEPEKSKETVEELSNLVVYTKSTKLKSLDSSLEKYSFNDLVSLSETKATSLIESHRGFLVGFNKRCQTRIYPKGLRTDSSNYDPMPFWNSGCNYVALNYQTKDEAMFIHEAFFSQNGRCGYVLKPHYLRDETKYKPNKAPPPEHKRYLHLKIISGQQLPKTNNERDIVDPYVVIRITGHILDNNGWTTKVVHNNGFNPVWNEDFKIPLVAPELAVLELVVQDQSESFLGKNELLGKNAIPVTCLAEGYRYVRLLDNDLDPILQSSIFVHVSLSSTK